MNETTARLAMPMIVPGQVQKELSHNEALVVLDAAVQASAVALGVTTPPDAPEEGACWIIGASPLGAWTGHADELAMWTAGGWRFIAPTEGFRVWVIADAADARFVDGAWALPTPAEPIVDPDGGTTVDSQARDAIAAILTVLRDHNFVENA